MKKMIFIFFIFLLLISVFADGIQQTAFSLKANTKYETAYNIDTYLWNKTDYQFYYYARSQRLYWEDNKGDCTEVAIAACNMARHLRIRSVIVHGYVWQNNIKIKHDWCKYYINGRWIDFEEEKFEKIKEKGYGIW